MASSRPIFEGRISLAYSVDADDAFMFHAVRTGAIDTRGLWFTHRRGDTAELNRLAASSGADVVAISAGAYPAVADRYLILPHGASVGRGYGPVVVAKQPMSPAELAGKRVGIPGESTTAWLVLRLIEPRCVPVVVPIVPFVRAFDALDAGEIDAALLIHEGRLLYEERGYVRVVELGEWWQTETGHPLPLGINVIRRALPSEAIAEVSAVLRESIAWSLAHRDAIIADLAGEDRGDVGLRDARLLDRYLGMYANQDTGSFAEDARAALEVLFDRARVAGLLSGDVRVEFAP